MSQLGEACRLEEKRKEDGTHEPPRLGISCFIFYKQSEPSTSTDDPGPDRSKWRGGVAITLSLGMTLAT